VLRVQQNPAVTIARAHAPAADVALRGYLVQRGLLPGLTGDNNLLGGRREMA
jgi:hypothetical protein